jgi:PQQ-dependent dehydrogenase (methanol/ethanol family)
MTLSAHVEEDTMRIRKLGFALAIPTLILAVLSASPSLVPDVLGQEVTFERLVDAGKDPNNWLMYLRTYDGHRYSPLSQINKTNVKKLVPVWAFQTGKPEQGLEATPLMADGVMYLSASWNRVFALDAASGKELWRYVHDLPKDITEVFFQPYNRGVALGHGKVFMGTVDGRLVALDMATGKKLWDRQVTDYKTCSCGITGAPLVVKDKVLTGMAGGELPTRGHLTAYHVETGEQVWRFNVVPGPGEAGHETWKDEQWQWGGGAPWMTGSYDAEQNLVIWGMGNPNPDYDWGGKDWMTTGGRPGTGLFNNTIIAVNPDTGKLAWHYQEIPHDSWDWPSTFEVVLLDQVKDGQKRKLLVHQNKGGWVWVLDRTNGQFVNAWPNVKHFNWIEKIGPNGELIGRNEPIMGKKILSCPAIGGGRSWNPASYSPRTGWWYSTGIEWCQEVEPTKTERVLTPRAQPYFGGDFTLKHPPGEMAHGHVDAWDPITGQRKWQVRHKYPVIGGVLATGGDLVFVGDLEGVFHAYDAHSGQALWSFRTGSGHRGGPITYAIKGKQYVAVPSGYGSLVTGIFPQLWPETETWGHSSTLFVFALPD